MSKLIRYLFAVFLCLSTHAHGQTLNKVLIIDTITGAQDKITVGLSYSDSITPVQQQWILKPQVTDRDSKSVEVPVEQTYPNIILPIATDIPYKLVTLPLDDSGGTLTLTNVFTLSADTIRISHLQVFHNCLPDTVRSGMHWYKNYNSDRSKQLRTVKSKIHPDKAISKQYEIKYPSKLSIRINKTEYTASLLSRQDSRQASWYCHGHKKMSRWHERIYERRIEKGKPYKYFSAYTYYDKYVLTAALNLNADERYKR